MAMFRRSILHRWALFDCRWRTDGLKKHSMKRLIVVLSIISIASLGIASAKEHRLMTTDSNRMKILTPASLPSNSGPSDNFTGTVRVTPLIQGEEPSCLTCASVGFEPGARSAWHHHPKG